LQKGTFSFESGPTRWGCTSSTRNRATGVERDGALDRRQLHLRAADYYASRCADRGDSHEWTSYDELSSDLKRFHHLVKAEQPLAAAEALSISKVDFLNYAGHVKEIQAMFADLDVGQKATRGLLMKRYALA
jgi:hypothetical protein